MTAAAILAYLLTPIDIVAPRRRADPGALRFTR